MTTVFKMHERFGAFLGDGDVANAFRFTEVEPAVVAGSAVEMDFEGVANMNDSFGNALIGPLIHRHPELLQSGLAFRNCTPTMKALLSMAVSGAQALAQPST